ncbi:hypothetical protein BGX24_012755 [Mortierella sp. AD032]|nr:hypothetical protein BGX24_012755 [Mortierella sp. AD032]
MYKSLLLLLGLGSSAFAARSVIVRSNDGSKKFQFWLNDVDRYCYCVRDTQTGSVEGVNGGVIRLFSTSDCTGNFQTIGSNEKIYNTQWVNSFSYGAGGIASGGPGSRCNCRVKVENSSKPKRIRTLAVADQALLENSAELEAAKSIALTALTRVKTLKATRRALLPAPALTAVPNDPALPFHAAIKRYFRITDIPTDPKTGDVHWVSIGGLADKDAPVFNLESSLKKASADTWLPSLFV